VACLHREWRKGIRRVGPLSLDPVNRDAAFRGMPLYEEGAVCQTCAAEAPLDGRGEPIWPASLDEVMPAWLDELRRDPPPLPGGAVFRPEWIQRAQRPDYIPSSITPEQHAASLTRCLNIERDMHLARMTRGEFRALNDYLRRVDQELLSGLLIPPVVGDRNEWNGITTSANAPANPPPPLTLDGLTRTFAQFNARLGAPPNPERLQETVRVFREWEAPWERLFPGERRSRPPAPHTEARALAMEYAAWRTKQGLDHYIPRVGCGFISVARTFERRWYRRTLSMLVARRPGSPARSPRRCSESGRVCRLPRRRPSVPEPSPSR